MVSLFLGLAAGLVPTVFLTLLLIWQNRQQQTERESWQKERESLLNRCMTKEWQSFQMMQIPTRSLSPSETMAGMSDEEELRRISQALGESQGLGEVIVDYADEFAELGLVARPTAD